MTDTMVLSLTIMGVLVLLLAVLRLRHVSLQGLVLGLIGAIVGLLVGALASVPLSKLPEPFGSITPMVVTIASVVLLMGVVVSRRRALLRQLPLLRLEEAASATAPSDQSPDTGAGQLPRLLVDTSVIIDGRIADIAVAGFVPGRLVVPRFVLAELQNIADSDDAMRRGRGRRGLDVLNRLRETPDVSVEIIEDDIAGIREVDAKLVALGQKFSCSVLTTDYNLNRVAQIQGVRVLNVNELSNAIRPVVLPGEELIVRVVQPGKERNQGVGYLADGTMIVVENGDKLMGQEVSTEVTRVFQTVAGKMIFAAPRHPVPGASHATAHPAAPAHHPAPAAHVAPVVAPEPPAAPVAPRVTPAPQAQAPASPDNPPAHHGHKPRFNRGHGNKPKPAGSIPAKPLAGPAPIKPAGDRPAPMKPNRNGKGGSIEDRIIAATNQPQPPADGRNQR